jgi:hypothetical protein
MATLMPVGESTTPFSIYESSSLTSIRASLEALHSRDETITSPTIISSKADLSHDVAQVLNNFSR